MNCCLLLSWINKNKLIKMRESKSGKSPKIDQFYRTLRNFTSAKEQEDDQLIEKIRLFGQEILENQKSQKGMYETGLQLTANSYDKLRRPSLDMREWKMMNLYDKYKYQSKLKTERKILEKTEEVANEINEMQKSREKLWKNPKYQTTKSKFLNATGVNTLNYEKRIHKKVNQEKKLKEEARRVKQDQINKKNKIKQRQTKYKVDKNFRNVLQRSQELTDRKNQRSEHFKHEHLIKEMRNVTFHPERVAKEVASVEKNLEKRQKLQQNERKEKQKQLIEKIVLSNKFTPKTNKNLNVESKTRLIWDPSPSKSRQSSVIRQEREIASLGRKQFMDEIAKTNENTRVTLRNQSQIQFLMNQ